MLRKDNHSTQSLKIAFVLSLCAARVTVEGCLDERNFGAGILGNWATRRLLQSTATIQPSIAAPSPLAVIQSPCCCVANASAFGGQTCCCGTDKSCCSAAAVPIAKNNPSVCQSGCAILWTFVGVAAALVIALMIAIYYRRQHNLVTNRYGGMRPFAGRGRRREQPKRPMQALPTTKPAPEEEGTVRECPICLEENTLNDDWTVFPCKHSTCVACYSTLCKGDPDLCICPMCRLPLMEPIPDPDRKWELTSTDGSIPRMQQRESAGSNTDPEDSLSVPQAATVEFLAANQTSQTACLVARSEDTNADSEFVSIPIDNTAQESR